MKLKLILILLSLFLLVGCVSVPNTPATLPSTQITYENSVYNYRINPPVDWQVIETPQKTPVTFMGPTEDFASILIEVQPATNLQTFFQSEKVRLSNFVFQPEQNVLLNGMNAIKVDYNYDIGFPLKVRQYYLVENGNGYVISYQAKVESFEQYLSDAEQSMNSFEVV